MLMVDKCVKEKPVKKSSSYKLFVTGIRFYRGISVWLLYACVLA